MFFSRGYGSSKSPEGLAGTNFGLQLSLPRGKLPFELLTPRSPPKLLDIRFNLKQLSLPCLIKESGA